MFTTVVSLLLLSSQWQTALCAPWLITEANEAIPVTRYVYDTNYEKSAFETTIIQPIIPTVTSLPEAISTITQTNTLESITAVEKLYPSGVGTAIDFYPYNTDSQHLTVFVVDITYTAPTSCSTTFSTTTLATIEVGPTLSALLPRTKTSISLSVDTRQAFQSTTYTYDQIWVSPTQIPYLEYDSLRNENFPFDLYKGANCYYTPGESGTYYYGSESGATSNDTPNTSDYTNPPYYTNWHYDWFDRHISPLALIIVCVVVWVVSWFILGIIEAWFRFRKLMLGWQTRRGLPVCWSLTILPVTLFCLFGFRKGFWARSQEDAVVLRERWNKMGFWRKIKLFLIWGFRYGYPDVLGPEPPRVGGSKRPGEGKVVSVPTFMSGGGGAQQPQQTQQVQQPQQAQQGQQAQQAQQSQQPAQTLPAVPETEGTLEEGRRAHSC